MGANASVLQLSHWEELPNDVLYGCVARLDGQLEKGKSWPRVSRVCKNWRRVAGMYVTNLRIECQAPGNSTVYKYYPHIQELTVYGRVSLGFLEKFGAITSLQNLSLRPDSYRKLLVNHHDRILLGSFPHLTRLELLPAMSSFRYMKGRDAQSLRNLVTLKELRVATPPASLYLYISRISTMTSLRCGKWEDELVQLASLNTLEIDRADDLGFEGAAVSKLGGLSCLCLNIDGALHTENSRQLDLRRLRKLPALSKMRLNYKGDLWSGTWLQLCTLSRLQSLHISSLTSSFTVAMVRAVVSMKQLVSLEVQMHSMTNSAQIMHHWPELQSMSCLKFMSWSCKTYKFHPELAKQACSMMEFGNLQGYMIQDPSGVQLA